MEKYNIWISWEKVKKIKPFHTGQWMIRCRICSQLTTWYGNTLNGLQDNTTMQQMVNKRSTKQQLRHNNDMLNTKNGKITMYGDQDLTINIVSSAKEKVEIQKALETAERKIELCQKQVRIKHNNAC